MAWEDMALMHRVLALTGLALMGLVHVVMSHVALM